VTLITSRSRYLALESPSGLPCTRTQAGRQEAPSFVYLILPFALLPSTYLLSLAFAARRKKEEAAEELSEGAKMQGVISVEGDGQKESETKDGEGE
jgi:hypothetical protein